MRELEYPFDPKLLLRKQKGIKRKLLEDGKKRIAKKIAVLGGSTTNDIVGMLELFLLNYGIQPHFYQSEYGRFYEDPVFENLELDEFKPDLIYIHTTNRNIIKFPNTGDSSKIVDNIRQQEFDRFEMVWTSLTNKYHCPIIQNNFELPYVRTVGNISSYQKWGNVNFITQLNICFYDYAQSHDNLYINDINYQSADFGLDRWYDPFVWYMYKYALSLEAIPTLAFNIANIIKSIYGKNKKALALDLDNTIWGGIVGDDGVEGLQIGHETSRGQVFEEFQQYLKKLQTTGILLNIISKNEENNALAGLKHPGMVLKTEDFISIKANWEPKSQNLINMAQELNLGVDSFVFVDDNPAERDIIRQQVPGVGVPELEKSENYIKAIDKSGFFEMTSFNSDDVKRNKMYKENAERTKLQSSFTDYNEYLKSLEMVAEIKPFQPVYLDRIAQLTNKSNQFNLTTLRCSRDEIEQMSNSNEFITLYGKLIDKFGDNGVVTVVVGQKKGEELDIVLWLMSCRVLKRDMEKAMLDELVIKAKEAGLKCLVGHYYPTEKNGMVKEFYGVQGFKKISEDKEGNSNWKLVVDDYKHLNNVIEIVKEIQEND